MIREATRADFPAIVRMLRDFHNASPGRHLPFSEIIAARAAMQAVDDPARLALLWAPSAVHGILAASIRQYPLGDARLASEDVFWIDPSHRGHGAEMIAAYEAWAVSKGAAVIGISCPVATAESLYARAGFKPAEVTFAKGL